ncbi:MAG: GatB/YqeY domain-containing protein [Patescibacteria group bacterium]|jgi:hypothetical protein|nr:GatB/YqeY domain-containing protein [Patescibacteria group bacterium]
MSLTPKIESDLILAIKNKEELTTSVLRMIKSAIKNAEIAKGDELNESETSNILEKQAKQRRDSITQYIEGNRTDLADKEKAELAIIEKYLPKKMTQSELSNLVDKVISETQANSISQMGQVIKEVMIKANGQADGKTVSEMVKTKLT